MATNPEGSKRAACRDDLRQWLSDDERAEVLAAIKRDGFCVLPLRLAPSAVERALAALHGVADRMRKEDPSRGSIIVHDIVMQDTTFLELMMFSPMLQVTRDLLGPSFQTCQSNMFSRLQDSGAAEDDGIGADFDFLSGTPWHADGPRPMQFPACSGCKQMGVNYVKFGVFLTDLTSGRASSLRVVRGSHLKPELDGLPAGQFDPSQYKSDLVSLDVEPGTVVCFVNSLWHSAGPNLTAVPRENMYFSFCPTWMTPIDHEPYTQDQLDRAPWAKATVPEAEARFILGTPRPPLRKWKPSDEDMVALRLYEREVNTEDFNYVGKNQNGITHEGV